MTLKHGAGTTLEFFTTMNSKKLLELLPIDANFLGTEPETLDSNPTYIAARELAFKQMVVNDHAEKGVTPHSRPQRMAHSG